MKTVMALLKAIHWRLHQQKIRLFFEEMRPDSSDTLLDVGGGLGISGKLQALVPGAKVARIGLPLLHNNLAAFWKVG